MPRQGVLWVLGGVSGVAATVAMECGWVVTEVGRQPWGVYRLQTTAAAATANGGIIASLSIVIALYAVLGAATVIILRALSRRWRRGDTPGPEVPYGPPARAEGRSPPPGGAWLPARAGAPRWARSPRPPPRAGPGSAAPPGASRAGRRGPAAGP